MADPVFRVREASYRYPGGRTPALRDLDFALGGGELTAVIGPNGAGKSTLVRLLTGIVRPDAGDVAFLGRALASWSRTELARRLAVVAQEPPPAVPMAVHEYVSLGRNPYVGPWASLQAEDHVRVDAAIARVDLAGLRDRRLTDLSGGELQRAKLARALAQDPDVLILDEPTAHLDIGHALWAFQTIAELVAAGALTVLCITHDINLASRFATRLTLLDGGRVTAHGSPAEVLRPDVLGEAYECEVLVEARGEAGIVVLPVVGHPGGAGV